MTPEKAHMHWLDKLSPGILPFITVGLPTNQGAGTAGIHVPGIPSCDITIGFEGDEHKGKGKTFRKGMKSIMLPAGIFEERTMLLGKMSTVPGPNPKVHIDIALATT